MTLSWQRHHHNSSVGGGLPGLNTVRVSLHQPSASTLQQVCDDAGDSVLIENNSVTWKWVAVPFWSDSIIFNENRIACVFAKLLQSWCWHLVWWTLRQWHHNKSWFRAPPILAQVCVKECLAAMMATKRSVGVTPEVNLRECATLSQVRIRLPTLTLNPRGNTTRSPKVQNMGISGPTKKRLMPPPQKKTFQHTCQWRNGDWQRRFLHSNGHPCLDALPAIRFLSNDAFWSSPSRDEDEHVVNANTLATRK